MNFTATKILRVAIKEHECDTCREKILIGEQYKQVALSKNLDLPRTVRLHMKCPLQIQL